MADHVELDAGSGGAIIASDEIGGVQYPRSKIVLGADGDNDGDVSAANPLPVTGTVAITSAELTTLAGAVEGSEMQVDIVGALPAGANVIGGVTQSGTWNIADITGTISLPTGAATAANQATANGHLATIAGASGPASIFNDTDLDETAVAVKASAGEVVGIIAINLAAAVRYLHLYDVAAGSVTVGTTAPAFTIALPSAGNTNGGGFAFPLPCGIEFATAISAAATTTVGGADAPGANEINVTVLYR